MTIQIPKGKEKLVIDKDKPLTLNRKQKTNDTADTYEVIKELKKHHAQPTDVMVAFFESGGSELPGIGTGWIELNFDSSIKVDLDKLEESMANIRGNFMGNCKVVISLEFSAVNFPKGQNFLDWVADKKLDMETFSAQEIKQ